MTIDTECNAVVGIIDDVVVGIRSGIVVDVVDAWLAAAAAAAAAAVGGATTLANNTEIIVTDITKR